MSVKHRLVEGRPSKWSPSAETHLVGDGPMNALDQQPTLCGMTPSGKQRTGPLTEVTCERCLASIRRQMRVLRG